MALSDAVMLSMLREGGAVLRRRGGWRADAGRNGACGASAKPAAAERLVSGVPPARSAGGGAGLPDLPREGRGRGVVSGAVIWGGGAWGRYMAWGGGGATDKVGYVMTAPTTSRSASEFLEYVPDEHVDMVHHRRSPEFQ